jgi:hypothetical protein
MREELLQRIQNYLESGGLFNPECMEHEKVRELIMDVRCYLLDMVDGLQEKVSLGQIQSNNGV